MKFIITLFTLISIYSQTTRVVALRVDFIEDDTEFTTGNGKFNFRQADPDSVRDILIDPPPHNREYFEDHLLFAKNYISHNLNIDLITEVYPSALNDVYHLPNKMAYYNPNLESDSLRRLTEMYVTAYNLALNDGVVINQNDIVIIFHAGTGNDVFLEIDFTPHDIPSISFNKDLILKYYPSWENQGRSTKGIVLPETASQEGFELAINGLIVANIASQIGLIDLVDPEKRLTVAGAWALEDRGLFNANGLLPSIPSAVNRYLLGIDPSKTVTLEIQTDTLIQIDSFKKNNSTNPQIIKIPLNETEFYLIENRNRPIYENDHINDLSQLIFKFTPANQTFYNFKQVLRDARFDLRNQFEFSERGVLINTSLFDAAIPHSGIIIWHLDQNIIDEKLTKNRINSDQIFRGARFLEADGIDNLNRNVFGAQDERFDVFYSENKAAIYQNKISRNSLPSTNSNYEESPTGLELYDFSTSAETMTFRVKRTDFINKTVIGEIKLVKHEVFANEFHLIHQDSNTIHLKLIELQTGELTLTSVKNENVSLGLSQFKNVNNSFWSFKNDSLYEFNSSNLTQNSVSQFETIIKNIFKLNDALFVLLANKKLYLHSNIETSLFATGIESGKEINSKLILIDSLDRVKELRIDVGIIDNVALLSDFYIEQDDKLLSMSINKNQISAQTKNSSLAYNFPINVPYKFEVQVIKWLKQLDNLIITQDEKRIVKLINISKPNTSKSYYLGNDIVGAELVEMNSMNHLMIYSKNRIMIDKISDEFLMTEFIYPESLSSGTIDKKRSFLWPNPNIDQLINIRVFSKLNTIATARIFNETGRLYKIIEFNTIANDPIDYQWDVSDVPSGTYIILLDVNGEQKIMKAAVVH